MTVEEKEVSPYVPEVMREGKVGSGVPDVPGGVPSGMITLSMM
jgi:hypothetical protein